MSFLKALMFVLFSILIFIHNSYAQLPQFVREKIEITVIDNSCQIVGDYYFRNKHSTPVKRNLFYPFPIDSTKFYPDSIKVIDVQKNTQISFINSKTGIYFPIEIPPKKTVLYKVFYSQKTTNNTIEYILTTTQKWGKPLEKAEFIIKLPSKFELTFLSFDYDDQREINNYVIYEIHKENFMPKTNLIVEWARRLK